MSWWSPVASRSSAQPAKSLPDLAAEDATLIESLTRGSPEALSRIYRLHGNRVFRAAYQHASSREMAEEVTQETFLLLLREPGKFDPARGELGAFLAGVARQLARRAHSRTQAASPIEWDENASPVDPAVAGVLDDMIARQEYRRLHEAIGTLPEPYRQTLVLHHLEGMPYEEVAALLGCPVGTIRSRLARARELLARKLEPEVARSARRIENQIGKGGNTDGREV
jgi:RNA polymerase sigma-70 factor (ECF subfamily)